MDFGSCERSPNGRWPRLSRRLLLPATVPCYFRSNRPLPASRLKMALSVPPVGDPTVDYAVPIQSRKRKTSLASRLRVTVAAVVFTIGCICINGTQFLLLPLKFIPPTRPVYVEGLRYTKAAAAILFSEFTPSY
jgi:hypothetical protein